MYDREPFIKLGEKLDALLKSGSPELSWVIKRAEEENPWFTSENVILAIKAVKDKMLSPESIDKWLSAYPESKSNKGKNIGVIMAGNIPLVGFFDMMCVLICGHNCYIKPSSKDAVLISFFAGLLKDISPDIPIRHLKEGSTLDAVIATGSDNTSGYFRSTYSGIPHIIRKSRSSVAVLAGDETDDELQALADDIFTYFGMGCRSVSKIFIPADYPLERLLTFLSRKNITFGKYLNIYRQHKAILTMRGESFLDGGFFTLRESAGQPEALCDILYSRYMNIGDVKEWIVLNDNSLQCIVSNIISHPRNVPFGKAQQPELWDYADGVNTIDFLNNI